MLARLCSQQSVAVARFWFSLPVGFNTSRRAMAKLEEFGFSDPE
jgi:Zn-dependent membrane protease YugP